MTALKISGQTLLFIVSVFDIMTNSVIRQLLPLDILLRFCGHVEQLVNVSSRRKEREQRTGFREVKGKRESQGCLRVISLLQDVRRRVLIAMQRLLPSIAWLASSPCDTLQGMLPIHTCQVRRQVWRGVSCGLRARALSGCCSHWIPLSESMAFTQPNNGRRCSRVVSLRCFGAGDKEGVWW